MNYCKARSLSDFFQKAAEAKGLIRPLAGGADIMYRLKKRYLLSDKLTLIDINGLDELKGIAERGNELEIGSAATLSAMEEFLKDRDEYSLLRTALRETACPPPPPPPPRRFATKGRSEDMSPAVCRILICFPY